MASGGSHFRAYAAITWSQGEGNRTANCKSLLPCKRKKERKGHLCLIDASSLLVRFLGVLSNSLPILDLLPGWQCLQFFSPVSWWGVSRSLHCKTGLHSPPGYVLVRRGEDLAKPVKPQIKASSFSSLVPFQEVARKQRLLHLLGSCQKRWGRGRGRRKRKARMVINATGQALICNSYFEIPRELHPCFFFHFQD